MLQDPERFSPALAREAFRLILGREIPADHFAALCISKPSAAVLLRQLLLSDEFLTTRASDLGFSFQESDTVENAAQRAETDLIRLFKALIGRIPNEAERQLYLQGDSNETDQLARLLRSDAFCLERGAEIGPIPHVPAFDAGLIRSVPLVASTPVAGLIIDAYGTKTKSRDGDDPAIAEHGVVEGYPLPRGNHQGGVEEWFGCMVGAHETGPFFNVMQIGGRCGEWMVSAVRAAKAFRASDHAMYFISSDPHAIVAAQEHIVLNALDPASAVLMLAPDDLFAADDRHDALISSWFSLNLPIAERGGSRGIDLVVLDWPRYEAAIIAGACAFLAEHAKCLMIKTSSRAAEAQIMERLSAAGLLLWRERPCALQVLPGVINTARSGAQVWRNPRFFQPA